MHETLSISRDKRQAVTLLDCSQRAGKTPLLENPQRPYADPPYGRMTWSDLTGDCKRAAELETTAPPLASGATTMNVFYATLEANSKVVTRGGENIGWPVNFAKLNSGSYRGMTPFPSQEKTINQRAQLEWKQLFVDIVVSGTDFERATGPLAVVDLVDELRQVAVMTAGDLMGTQVFSDGTGNGGLDLDGVLVGIDNSTLYPTYAGISRSTNTWWRGNVNSTGGNLTTSAMNVSYGTATVGNAHPTLEITTQTLWNKLLDRVIPSQRYEASDERNRTARIGFDTIRHLGADVVHDSHCPSGNIFYVNVDDMELRVNGEHRMFGWTGWKTPELAGLSSVMGN